MTPTQHVIFEIIKVELDIAAAAGVLFVIIYQARWKWWRSSMGTHMMLFMAGITLDLVLTVISTYWPAMPGVYWWSLFAWTVIAFLFVWRTLILFNVNREPPLTVKDLETEIQRLEKLKSEIQR